MFSYLIERLRPQRLQKLRQYKFAGLLPVLFGKAHRLLPQNLLASDGTLLEDFETTVGWTALNSSTMANDAVNYKTGTQSIKSSANTGTATGRINKTVTYDFTTSGEFRLWVYCPNITNMAGANLIFPNQGDFSKYIRYSIPLIQNGWNLVRFPVADFTAVGEQTISDPIIGFRLSFFTNEGTTADVSWDTFRTHCVSQPAIAITFDDACESTYTQAFTYMRTRNVRGTAYIITDNIDAGGRLSTAQIVEMYSNGWTIGNHTDDHTDLTTLSQAEAQANLAAGKTALEAIGISGNGPSHVAYPFGAYNDTVLAAMAAEGMLTGRTGTETGYHCLPFDQQHIIHLSKSFVNTVTLATAKSWVDSTLSRKELGVALFHDLVESPSVSTEWGISDFQDLIDYIKSKGIPLVTMDDAYKLQSGSVVIPS